MLAQLNQYTILSSPAGALNPETLSSTTAVTPLVAELTTAFTSATNSLDALNSGGILGLEKRADDPTVVANQLASISTVCRQCLFVPIIDV